MAKAGRQDREIHTEFLNNRLAQAKLIQAFEILFPNTKWPCGTVKDPQPALKKEACDEKRSYLRQSVI
jgi:hypothetical protein